MGRTEQEIEDLYLVQRKDARLSMLKKREPNRLDLRVGELVEVRSPSDILNTLDSNGALDALPCMPEMLRYGGRRFRVYKRVDKVCDTIDKTGFRRMNNTVLLEGVRCDGAAHGGCQARCMILWKEAWLRRVSAPAKEGVNTNDASAGEKAEPVFSTTGASHCTEADLRQATRKRPPSTDTKDETFSCQATELKAATSPLAWWDLRQYARDLCSGNVSLLNWACGVLIILFNAVQRLRGGSSYPHLAQGKLKKTPHEVLNLQAGDLVEVKAEREIWRTLDVNNKNRGLWFDVEMLKFCGEKHQVLGRVQQMINEKTGRMLRFTNDCIILDEVKCNGDHHQFCPRSEYIYWREIWLRRTLHGDV